MGISHLFQILQSKTRRVLLSSYSNKRAAIDAYVWLHRSIYVLTDEVLTTSKIDYSRCMIYLKNNLLSILNHHIIPIFIFDGNKLPMKSVTEEKRNEVREKAKRDKNAISSVYDKLSAIKNAKLSIDITPTYAYEFIKILNEYHIEYYVAPYEADIQMAYLIKNNYVDFIITEDSDLIALGCKCVLTKLKENSGEEILYGNIFNKITCDKNVFDFSDFDEDKFLAFCILCGCDYFKIKGVGVKSAYDAIKKFNNYEEALRFLCNKGKEGVVFEEEITEFEKAFLTFRYQVIYNPKSKKMEYFNDINKSKYPFAKKYKEDLSFLGEILTEKDIRVDRLVKGEIDPITHEEIVKESVKNKRDIKIKKDNKSSNENILDNKEKNGKKGKGRKKGLSVDYTKRQKKIDFFWDVSKDKKEGEKVSRFMLNNINTNTNKNNISIKVNKGNSNSINTKLNNINNINKISVIEKPKNKNFSNIKNSKEHQVNKSNMSINIDKSSINLTKDTSYDEFYYDLYKDISLDSEKYEEEQPEENRFTSTNCLRKDFNFNFYDITSIKKKDDDNNETNDFIDSEEEKNKGSYQIMNSKVIFDFNSFSFSTNQDLDSINKKKDKKINPFKMENNNHSKRMKYKEHVDEFYKNYESQTDCENYGGYTMINLSDKVSLKKFCKRKEEEYEDENE